MEKKIPFTQEAYDQLVKDLNNLKNVERPRVLQELVDARAQGDLSENAEYHAAKERLAAIDNGAAKAAGPVGPCRSGSL